jgi:putative DNA primase/helicase
MPRCAAGYYPLVALAELLNAVLLGVSHFSKGTNGRDPLERVTGSLAFGAMARIVFGTVRQEQIDDDAPRRYTLARCKSNIGPDSGGYSYAMEPAEPIHGVSTCRIAWGQAVEGQAKDLLAEAEPDTGDRTERDEAALWLRGLLADGPMPAKGVWRHANGDGLAWRTVQRATAEDSSLLVSVICFDAEACEALGAP